MVERRGGLCLLDKPLLCLVVGCENFGQDFQRHISIEPLVARQVNFAHAAGAEFFNYLVMTERASDHAAIRTFAGNSCSHNFDSRGLEASARFAVSRDQRFDLSSELRIAAAFSVEKRCAFRRC